MTHVPTVRRGPKPNPHTRANLLRAGVKMIHDTGFNAAGIKDIVLNANVPKGSFYNYFASKEEFGAQVVDAYFEESLVGLRAILRDPQSAPVTRLRRYFSERAAGLDASGHTHGCLLGNLTLEVADHSNLIRERIARHFATWSGLFEDCIAEAQRDGSITNPLGTRTLAEFLLNSWEGAILRARAEKSRAPMDEFIQVTFEAILA